MNKTKKIEKILEENSINKNYYNYIQNDIDLTISAITFALKQFKNNPYSNPIRILDIGSGIGGTLLIMKTTYNLLQLQNSKSIPANAWFEGIEIDPTLIPISKKLTIKDIEQIDALDFKHYNKYDIIYYYHPIRDHKLEKRLEQKIEKEAKPGSIIISMLKEHSTFDNPKNLKKFKILGTLDYATPAIIEKTTKNPQKINIHHHNIILQKL